jgi:KDO2-lipid IV(A) lauroyltransferase
LHFLIYIISFPVLFIISRLPFLLFYLISDILSFFLRNIFRYRKKIIEKNISQAFPDLGFNEKLKIKKKFYTHMCDLFLEIIKSMGMSKKEMTSRFKIKNIDVLNQFENLNKSCFIMCGHYSSWEWMMSLGYHINHPGIGIYTPLANPYFDKLIQKIRRKHNAFLLSRHEAFDNIIRNERLNNHAVYGFASDQSPSPTKNSYWRKFMGIKVPVFTGAERLSIKLNIPLVFADINRIKRGHYEVEFILLSNEPKSTKENEITNTFTDLVEKQIRKDPSQYLWSHNRFKHAIK